MGRKSIIVIVTSGRTLEQGRMMERGKLNQEYADAVAICELSKTTMKILELQKDDVILVTSKTGHTKVKCKTNDRLEDGIAFIPCGPYFNELIGSYTQQTGMPSYKTVEATISPALGEKIKSIEEIVQEYREENTH